MADDGKTLTWPIGDCKTFEEFAAKYQNPDGTWKDTPWLNERGWHNDRFVETFINDTRRDFEGERLPLEAQIRAMPFFMENGRYEYYHGTKTGGTPVPLGKPVAWRIRDGMIESRFGVFSSADTGHPFSDEKWRSIQQWGTRGTSSVVFAPIGPKYLRREGPFTTLDIPGAWLFDVGFVGPMGASPGSTNNFVSDAKGLVQMKAYLQLPDGEPENLSDWKSFFDKRQCPYCHKTFHGRDKLQEHIDEMQARDAPSHMESFLRSDIWEGLFESKKFCPTCGGSGKVRETTAGPGDYKTCPTCHGRGVVSGGMSDYGPGGAYGPLGKSERMDILLREIAIDTKPFAGYANFQDCKDKNRDKNNVDAYCGYIKHQTEDKGLDHVPEDVLREALELDAKASPLKCRYCGGRIRGNAAAEEYDTSTGGMKYTCSTCSRLFKDIETGKLDEKLLALA